MTLTQNVAYEQVPGCAARSRLGLRTTKMWLNHHKCVINAKADLLLMVNPRVFSTPPELQAFKQGPGGASPVALTERE
jgi:hypothetical protein